MFWPLFMCFSPYLGVCGGGGGTKGSRAHNLLMQFSGLGSSKMEISETDFFDTLTIQNDQISYAKHVLAPLHVLFTLFGCVWGGGSQGRWGTTCLCSSLASATQEWSSLSPLRGALPKAIEFFVAAHCVVVWVTVLWGTATCIPCTHGGTFCLLSLKWNLTAQPCFPPGQM